MLRRAGETAKVIEGEAIDVTPPPVRKSQVLSRSLPLVQVSASYVHACRSGQSRPAPPRPLRYGHTSFVVTVGISWRLAFKLPEECSETFRHRFSDGGIFSRKHSSDCQQPRLSG
jgi:hypothetical protein